MNPRLTSVFALLASTFLRSAHNMKAPLPGHSVQPQLWTVPITPGGPLVSFHGTVQQLLAQVTKLNPNYEAELAALTPDAGPPGHDSSNERKKRDLKDHTMSRYRCGYDFYDVDTGTVSNRRYEGSLIGHLESLEGQPTLAPMACSRVSCEHDHGIWWCNSVSFSPRSLDNPSLSLGDAF